MFLDFNAFIWYCNLVRYIEVLKEFQISEHVVKLWDTLNIFNKNLDSILLWNSNNIFVISRNCRFLILWTQLKCFFQCTCQYTFQWISNCTLYFWSILLYFYKLYNKTQSKIKNFLKNCFKAKKDVVTEMFFRPPVLKKKLKLKFLMVFLKMSPETNDIYNCPWIL